LVEVSALAYPKRNRGCAAPSCSCKTTRSFTCRLPSPTQTMDLTGPDIYRSVQAVLRDLDCQNPSSSSHRGMLRWTLHKKMEKDPSRGVVLVEILVKELEKAQRTDCKRHIIPLLLTLIYAVIQSVYIPNGLHVRVRDCCHSLLKLPLPYSSVALDCAKQMQTERSTPGALYQRMVVAEQSLQNEFFPFQEMVFVFGDAAVFSGPLGDVVRRDLELVEKKWGPLNLMHSVVQRTLQAALGKHCHGDRLAHALKEAGQGAECYFREVLEAVEHNGKEVVDRDEDKKGRYMAKLQRLYNRITSTASEGEVPSGDLCDTPVPTPEVRFHLWRDDGDLWLQPKRFTSQSCAALTAELQSCRASQLSTDSGIDPDLPEAEASKAPPGGCSRNGRLGRKFNLRKSSDGCYNLSLLSLDVQEEPDTSGGRGGGESGGAERAGNSPTPCKNPGLFTARVVLMGDDKVLGRLAKAYYSLRKGDIGCCFFTSRVNLEMYYIPVTEQHPRASAGKGDAAPARSYLDVASYLGRVDPWYDCNINSLSNVIPALAETQATVSGSLDPDPFLLDVLSYYTRMARQTVHFPIYMVKILSSDLNKGLEEDVFLTHVEVGFPEFVNARATLKESMRHKRTMRKMCGPVVSITYTKALLNNRQVDTGMSRRTLGITISAIPSSDVEGNLKQSDLLLHMSSQYSWICTEAICVEHFW
ncbi:hypothetical protein JZ751_013348, partial [Albula glossodonta]